MNKRKNILIIYGIVVIILLIIILFVVPDSYFIEKYNESSETTKLEPKEKKEFTDYELQIEHLLNKNFEYEYILLDSMGTKSYSFECSGKISGTIESGSCTTPTKVSYTEKDVARVFENIDSRYLDVKFIFDIIKDVEKEETKYQTLREYNYKVKITDLDTDITVHTDLNEITKIYISNAYMTYILKYSNVTY